jgi:TrmH family RNA methyltransferase
MIIQKENDEYQIISALKGSRQKRRHFGEAFVEGTECIRQADRAGLPFTRIISAGGMHAGGKHAGEKKLSDWAEELIRRHDEAARIEMAAPLYRALCDREEAPELLATVKTPAPVLENLRLPPAYLPPEPFIVLFDRPSDFGNLGSLVRAANAFGADAVFITGHGVDVWEPKVIRASLGAVFHTPVLYIDSTQSLESFIRREKARNGLFIAGTDSSGAEPLPRAGLKRPVMVLIGNEAKGLSVALQGLCDVMVKIPLAGGRAVNSLNAAGAASIIMYQVAAFPVPDGD